ncbi:lactate utilization protein C [Denitrobacterium detoxificans]|jgi:L-lactate dehydrogenase complex protein LldG|uniref:LutC/YkgG family protein n=1 Tax=Denitrobacterium detoxificans TaxID=79604 RepID=UPI0026EC76A7|nr:lactate utilization protein C [Denitrobacterium detoxificans]MBE6465758.1 lactate utilization protein C [Denitrobacterium detoxificans]
MSRCSLDDFLAPISARLGHEEVPEAPTQGKQVKRPVRVTDGLSHDALVDMFVEQAQAIRVSVVRTTAEGAADAVAKIVSEARAADAAEGATVQVGPAVYSAQEKLAELGIPAVLGEDAVRWDVEAGHDAMLQACNQARFGVTYAAGAIAETGTIVQPMTADCGRSVSLLPLAHIVLIDASTMKPTMREALDELDAARKAGGKLASQVCFISGPSVTSDIELVRVEGVHGPMYVYYVVVE